MNRSPAWLVWLAACAGDPAPRVDSPSDGSPVDTGTTWADTAPEPTPGACLEQELTGPFPLAVDGDTRGAGDEATGSCGGNGAEDVIYSLAAPEGGRFRISTTGTTDTVLYARLDCDGEELACNDDARFGLWGGSAILVDIPPGRAAAVVVDSYSSPGPFQLQVDQLPQEELACADGQDEDLDRLVDCLDPDCAAVGTCAPRCPDLSAGEALPEVVLGTTLLQPDEHRSACGRDEPAADQSTLFTAPFAGTWGFFLSDYPSGTPVLSLRESCGGEELTCSTGAAGGDLVQVQLAAGESVLAVVDGERTGVASDYTLEIFQVGPEACGDALDNDADGSPDCLDPDCAAAPECAPTCPEERLSGDLPLVVEGTTYGRSDDHESACGGAGSDLTFAFLAPEAGRYTFHTQGSSFDTVLSVLDACGGGELECDDDTGGVTSQVSVDLAADQEVIVVLDAYSDAVGGPFQLTVLR